jgi:competence protein ComEA
MKHLIAHWLWAISGCVAAQTIELERAREIDLDGLRGLGPTTTRRILEERERQPFRDWKDLMQRTPGIGPKKAMQLSEQGLRVQGQPFPTASRH